MLNNMSLLSGATCSATGGSALPFQALGTSPSSNVVYATGDSDIRTRREIRFDTRAARPQGNTPNGYTQARAIALVKIPLLLDNGESTVNTVRIEIACDVETTESEKDELCNLAAQVLFDTDTAEFRRNLSVV